VKLAFRMAWRELRNGARGMRIVLLCIAFGVAAIAGVGSLRESVDQGLAQEGQRILGGNFEIDTGAEPPPQALRNWLLQRGQKISQITRMRSLLVATSGERLLVDVKAVDGNWPMVGAVRLLPQARLPDALAARAGRFGLVAERLVLDRLGLKPGDLVRLGRASFEVRAVLADEPDRVATISLFGPRVVISDAALPATGLIQFGSMVEHRLRVLIPAGIDREETEQALRTAFADQGFRIRDETNAVPGAKRFLDRNALFLTLVALTALLVGGIGVSKGVDAWLTARMKTLATLRCLGASPALVFEICLVQVMLLSTVAVVAGALAGAMLPPLGARFLREALPVPLRFGFYARPLALAGIYGLLTAGCFAWVPLRRAVAVPAAALFRGALAPVPVSWQPGLIPAIVAFAASLIGLTILAIPDRVLALWFCGGVLGSFAVFALAGLLLQRLSRCAPYFSSPSVRLGLANLYRPGASTLSMLVALGLGLSTLATVVLIEGNLKREILEDLPTTAPSFYFIDILPSEVSRFDAVIRHMPGVQKLDEVPSLRARVVAVAGVPANQVKAAPGTEWGLRGDRGLTYAAEPPPGTRLVSGRFWAPDYHGPPLVSFDAELARGWGVKVGDTLRINVLGRDIDLKVANLREINWRSLALNFTLLASPGMFEHAPRMYIAAVKTAPELEGKLLRAVTDALPNVTGIRVTDVIQVVGDLLRHVAAAFTAAGLLALVSGVLVLAGALAASQRRRTHEAVILRTLGASRGQVLLAWLTEFGALGLTAGLIAAVVGTAASYGVVHFLLHGVWIFLPGALAATLAGAVAVTLGFGYISIAVALAAKPGPLLRNE